MLKADDFELDLSGVSSALDTRGIVTAAQAMARIRTCLEAGEVETAIRLYEQSGTRMASELLEIAREKPPELQKRFVAMFEGARDFGSAASLAESGKRWSDAGRLFESARDFAAAARAWERGGELARAAAAYERIGSFDKALQLHAQLGPSDALATLLAKSGKTREAADMFRAAGNTIGELEILRAVPMEDPSRPAAVVRMAQILRNTNELDAIVNLCVDSIRQSAASRNDRELHQLLMDTLEALGRPDHAEQVRARLRKLDAGANAARATGTLIAANLPPTQRPTSALPVPPPRTTGASVVPVVPPSRATGSVPAQRATLGTSTFAAPGSADAYSYLKAIPIFGELSMEDMKELFRLAKQLKYPPGMTLIEQGVAGTGLVVLLSGDVKVVRVDGFAAETELARLGPGQWVGEMTLFDEQPTSARVVTEGGCAALFISRERFASFLYGHDEAALRIYKLFASALVERLRQTNLRK